MHRSKPEKFSELLLKVRQTLVNPPPNLQSDSLATLLLLLESHLLRWPSALPEKTGVIEVDMLDSDSHLCHQESGTLKHWVPLFNFERLRQCSANHRCRGAMDTAQGSGR